MGAPDSLECQSNLDRMLLACRRLGVPVAQEKCAGPATKMVFLGFELDSLEMIIRLPEEKLGRTMQLIKEWDSRKACRKRDLESLVGHLQHAATVVRPGRTFVRRLIVALLSEVTQPLGSPQCLHPLRSDMFPVLPPIILLFYSPEIVHYSHHLVPIILDYSCL